MKNANVFLWNVIFPKELHFLYMNKKNKIKPAVVLQVKNKNKYSFQEV